MNLFLWGFLSKPWKRLLRTISFILIILLILNLFFNSNDKFVINILSLIVILVPLFSYLTEPFINKSLPKIDNYKKDSNSLDITKERSRVDMTDEEVREVGRRFLEELKEKGPDLSKVGQTFVRKTNSPLFEIKDEEFDYPDKTREFRKLKCEIMKEFPERDDSKKNE